MKVFVEISRFATTASRAQLRDMVARLEDAGATGVTVSDHLFHTVDGVGRRDGVDRACEPLTTLAAVAALSDRLEVQTIVMNAAWIHPALLLRQFSQLAVLAGGERVTAGLGAGWSPEEFAALGRAMPPFRSRMQRLEEVLALARQLYDTGWASLEGAHVEAVDVPLSPFPERAPRLLVGGGSDRALRIAGRYADVLDLHGDPRHGKVAGATMEQARRGDVRRRARTTVEDLEARAGLLRAAAAEAGRPPVEVSTQVWYVAFGSPAEVHAAEEELCTRWGIPGRQLDRNPYVLLGSPAQMAEALRERRERYGLDRIALTGEGGVRSAPPQPLRFCREVLPLLS